MRSSGPSSADATRQRREAGFTLIELLIVLIIVGLVVGAVLKAKELVDAAALRSQISQLRALSEAVEAFRTRYGALPGDFAKADTQLGATARNGNGDGLLSDEESTQVWAHLAAAGLIRLPPNETLPPSELGDGRIEAWFDEGGDDGGRNVLRIVPANRNPDSGRGLLTAFQAGEIDIMLDDGLPRSGRITAVGISCIDSDSYDVRNETPSCTLLIELD